MWMSKCPFTEALLQTVLLPLEAAVAVLTMDCIVNNLALLSGPDIKSEGPLFVSVFVIFDFLSKIFTLRKT